MAQLEAHKLSRVFRLMQDFHTFDLNKDRRIEGRELQLAYDLTYEEVRGIMRQADTDSDGVLSLAEFLVWKTKDMEIESLAVLLKSAFELADTNGDGVITADELFQFLVSEIGDGFSFEDCLKIIDSMDEDGNGVVSPQELNLLLNSLP